MRARSILTTCLVSFVLSASGAAPGVRDAPGQAEFDIQGHRGFRGRYPENSLPGFRAALALRVTTLELDLQATGDRVLVVHHDRHLDPSRCIHDDGSRVAATALQELSWAELATIDCGRVTHRTGQRAAPGTRIPRLEQVLEIARDADYPVRLSIEIKLQDEKRALAPDELARLLVDALRRFGLEQRTIVQSFRPPALRAVRELAPEVDRAILVRDRRLYAKRVEEAAATILSPRYDGLTRRDVERFQAQGIAVIPWTVNKPKAIARMIDWGVDGLITDYPDRAQQILQQTTGRAAVER